MEKVFLDIYKEEGLSETVRSFPDLCDRSHKGFEEKDTVKSAWDGVPTELEFIQTDNYYFNPFSSSFYCIQFNPFISYLYPQYHLISPFTIS